MTPEELVTLWQGAAEALDSAGWSTDPRWLQVLDERVAQCEASIRRTQDDAAQSALAVAQARVRELGRTRLAAMALEVPASASARDVVVSLKAARPVHTLEVCARNRDRTALMGLVGGLSVWLGLAALILTLGARYAGRGLIAPALVESFVVCLVFGVRAMFRWRAGRLIATEHTIRVATAQGTVVLPFDGLEASCVPLDGGLSRITLRDRRHTIELETVDDASALLAHLGARGVNFSQ